MLCTTNSITSFSVDHLSLRPGLYVSRKDKIENCVVTTFDIRLTTPNREPVVDNAALHSIEHLAAVFFRTSVLKDVVLYFGPMGCRTGCYLLVFGDMNPQDIVDLVVDMCDYILEFSGDIPGAKPEQCGNYLEHDLQGAKRTIQKYKAELIENRRFCYPHNDCPEANG